MIPEWSRPERLDAIAHDERGVAIEATEAERAAVARRFDLVAIDRLSADLTKPFFRGDTARTSATGAGLGLSIVDKTVQRMGGHFRLENSPEGGLVAHIELVRAAPPQPSSQRLVVESTASLRESAMRRLWRPRAGAKKPSA